MQNDLNMPADIWYHVGKNTYGYKESSIDERWCFYKTMEKQLSNRRYKLRALLDCNKITLKEYLRCLN